MSIVELPLELAHKIWHSNLQSSCSFSPVEFLLDSLCFQSPQTTTDHFKRLPRVVRPERQHRIPRKAWPRLCWVELPFSMGQSSGRMAMLLSFYVDMVTCWISTLSACSSIIYPPSNLSLLDQCRDQFPSPSLKIQPVPNTSAQVNYNMSGQKV